MSVYGLGRFPVTLYKEQWAKLLDMADDIRAFIRDHEAELKAKEPRWAAEAPVVNFELTAEQQEVRALARDFAEREVAPVIRRFDEAQEFPHEILRGSGAPGSSGALVPEEYGGAGLDYVSYALAVEELNRVDGSVGITMWAHNSLCTNHIALFGSPAQKRAYLPAAGPGRGAGGVGPDRARIRLRRRRHEVAGDAATASTSSSAGARPSSRTPAWPGSAVVMAVTDPARGSKGISAFILERGLPGFTRGPPYRKLGLHASNTAELVLDDVRVPAGQLCGELGTGFVQSMQVLEGGRIAMAAMAVGLAQGALDQARRYMKQRTAFGRPLAEFNGLQGMLADIATEVEAARLLTLRAAALKDRGRPARLAASMAKLFASEVAMRAASRALQIHGGAGYITEFPIERIFRDAKLTEIGEGTSEIQRLVIAREILACDDGTPGTGAPMSRARVRYRGRGRGGQITLEPARRAERPRHRARRRAGRRRGRGGPDPAVWVVVVRGARAGVLLGHGPDGPVRGRDRRAVLPPLDPRPELPRGHGQAHGGRAPRLLDRRRAAARGGLRRAPGRRRRRARPRGHAARPHPGRRPSCAWPASSASAGPRS